MDKNVIIASDNVENVLPDYFQFRLWQSEVTSEGAFIKEYAEKPEEILKRILQVLEKHGI